MLRPVPTMKKNLYEHLSYAVILGLGYAMLVQVDAFEAFYSFSRAHEHWELDECVLTIPLLLICITIFALMRFFELQKKTSELQQAQNKLAEANSKLKELARSKEEFMSIACHELKGPISGIVHSLKLLELSRNDEEREEAIEFVTSAAGGLHLMVDDVLAFSKLTHETSNEQYSFTVANLMKSVHDLARPQVEARKLDLHFMSDPLVPKKLFGNEGAIRLALLNLVGNAIKYTDSGQVTVQSSYRHDSRELIFSVRDTGVGIPETEQETIFEPYCKASGSSHRMRDGLGLGLSIVKKLIEQQGGTISVSSTMGEGTEFIVSLPAATIAHS